MAEFTRTEHPRKHVTGRKRETTKRPRLLLLGIDSKVIECQQDARDPQVWKIRTYNSKGIMKGSMNLRMNEQNANAVMALVTRMKERSRV